MRLIARPQLLTCLLMCGVGLYGFGLAGCRASTGTLELRLVLPDANLAGFRSVELTPTWAGAYFGYFRDDNPTPIHIDVDAVRLPGQPARTVSIARGDIPARHYDRVAIDAPTAYALDPAGGRVPLISHIEPIARQFDLSAGKTVVIDIELIIVPRAARSGGGWLIFVKDAQFAPSGS